MHNVEKIKTDGLHLLFLHFHNKEIERNFIGVYDSENRIFYRIGIFLSCFAWSIWFAGIYFSHRNVFATALTVLLNFLFVPFIIVVTLSYFRKYSTHTHYITAGCNFIAACVCIFVAVYLIKDITFLCAGVICISFFCYFILRIRFKVSLLITLSYATIGQIAVLASGNFSINQVYVSSSGIWLGFFIAMMAGYFFEKTNRKLFVQNKLLEQQHIERERTRELELLQAREIEKAYKELKAAQAQLVQKEKMASLGELTAGIAHEIQNPLNFVNNFSALNQELVSELKQEAQSGNTGEVLSLAGIIEENEGKISHHGRRADNIVKSMLQHSRGATGEREPADLNAFVEQYLQLAYHGYRAKDKNFNTDLSTHYDPAVRSVNLVPQEIGRVLLNLFNNAFYAVGEKTKLLNGTYEPTVQVSTKKEGNYLAIAIKDNGTGMSKKIAEKVFQPFFTTKPTGEGTGLGLSLSYDIVTKGHGGNLSFHSTEGEGSEFVIELPVT